MSRLGSAGPRASFCTSPPASPIGVAIVRMRRRLDPAQQNPLVSGVQVGAHCRLTSGWSMPRGRRHSPFPSKSLPRRIAFLIMYCGFAPDAEGRRSHQKRPPRLVEAPELDGERREVFASSSGTLGYLSRCGSTRHRGTKLGRRLPRQQGAHTVAGLRQSAERQASSNRPSAFRVIRACCCAAGYTEPRTTSRKADQHLARRGPSSSAAHAICFGEGSQCAVGPPP